MLSKQKLHLSELWESVVGTHLKQQTIRPLFKCIVFRKMIAQSLLNL